MHASGDARECEPAAAQIADAEADYLQALAAAKLQLVLDTDAAGTDPGLLTAAQSAYGTSVASAKLTYQQTVTDAQGDAALADTSAPAPALDTIPIEQIRVGQRVLTGAAAPDKTLPTAVDEQTWRHLTLEETDTWSDGTVDRICVESLLPPDWLALYDGAPVGSRVPIPLDLEEMGLPEGMTAQVVANEPCPPIDHGPGRVVLTTVNHLNPRVVELTLQVGTGRRTVPDPTVGSLSTHHPNQQADPLAKRPLSNGQPLQEQATNGSEPYHRSGSSIQETVRPTAFHKFYSETRQAWLSAEDLQPGEILRGLSGPLQVVSQRPVPGPHRVYNMTVEGEHVYHVSTLGVLAHNMMCAKARRGVDTGVQHDAHIRAYDDLPVFRLSKSDPAVADSAQVIEEAISAGHPSVLSRGPGRAATIRNRTASQRNIRRQQGPPRTGYNYDEYPFASAEQGGAGAFVREVLADPNQEAGRRLGRFLEGIGEYADQSRIPAGGWYRVIIDP